MKKRLSIIICIAISFQCCGQSQIQNKEFAEFIGLFNDVPKYPFNYKKDVPKPIYENYRKHEISLNQAKKYLNFNDQDWYAIEQDYNYDEDILRERVVDNPPLAHLKMHHNSYMSLIYRTDKGVNNDTLQVFLETFTLHGKEIDKIVIGGQYTREEDWRDVVFLEDNILRIFDYKPNLENYNVKNGAYYIIDKEQPQTAVEINDYQIDENGKINHIKKHPKQYLKEFVSFYRSYHKDSDDPMNEY
jgi:hypothetical protein